MSGIPEYGTGRHEDYLRQQEERAELARDAQAEEADAAFADWADSEGYAKPEARQAHVAEFAWDDMADAFAAGMRAARELDAARAQRPAWPPEADG